MPQFLLDTDHLTLFDHAHPRVMQRIAIQPPGAVGLAVVTAEEYLRGRLTAITQAKDGPARILRYRLFVDTLQLIHQFPLALFDHAAEGQYQLLRALRLRIGTRDQKIAAIALAANVILVTRNKRDFGQIPGLVFEDWSV